MRWFIASIFITSLMALPVSFLVVPIVFRHKMISQLDAANLSDREAALRFVRLRAGKDEAVLRDTLTFLATARPMAVVEVAHELERAKAWSPAITGESLWLRWIDALSQDEAPAQRENAATLIAEIPMESVRDDAAALLTKLAKDENIGVRYQAVLSAAALVGRLHDRPVSSVTTTLRGIIVHAAMSETPEFSRRAVLLAAFTGGLDDAVLPPTDSASLLLARRWAKAVTAAPSTQPNAWRYAIANFAALRGDDSATPVTAENLADALANELEDGMRDGAGSDFAAAKRLQRLVLCDPTPFAQSARNERLDAALARLAVLDVNEPGQRPLALAAINRLGARPRFTLDLGEIDWLTALAWLESPRTPALRWKEPVPGRDNDLPDALQLAIIRAAPGATADDLLPLLSSNETHVRDLACVTVIERFGQDDALRRLVRDSLLNYSDDAKRSGAVLSGLTGVGMNLLKSRAELEDVWTVLQIMRLGLWLQGRQPSLDGRAADFWMRKDIPKSTLLFVLLHRDPRTAMNLLLHPRGEPLLDVIDLLNTKRWWPVLSRHLPDDAPPFWVWADEGFQAFQLDTLRAWYIVNGHRMETPSVAPLKRNLEIEPPTTRTSPASRPKSVEHS